MLASEQAVPTLTHFRIEIDNDAVAHLIFDMADSAVNVLSQASIADFGAAVRWFEAADVRGLVIQSGKATFCVGGDLGELGASYDRISALPTGERDTAARAFFAPMNRHLLRLERSGKPVSAAIAGLALGGGCELALAAHHRVLGDTPSAAIGLPEVPIGLMPGAGGTQRLPRLVGVEAALPILLDGVNLSLERARDVGIVDELVPAGAEIETARQWVLQTPRATQPWEKAGWSLPDADTWRATVAAAKADVLSRTGGRDPAPLAVLHCLDNGLMQRIDIGIDWEIAAFATLIQRPEPRHMIRALFVGAQDYARRRKKGNLPSALERMDVALRAALASAAETMISTGLEAGQVRSVIDRLGFGAALDEAAECSVQGLDERSTGEDYWFNKPKAGAEGRIARILMNAAAHAYAPLQQMLPQQDHALADYVAIREHGFPAWSGGPLAWLGELQSAAQEPNLELHQ